MSVISRISQELVKNYIQNSLIVVVVFESHWLGGVLALALVVVVRRVGPRVPSERNKQTVRGTPLNLFI